MSGIRDLNDFTRDFFIKELRIEDRERENERQWFESILGQNDDGSINHPTQHKDSKGITHIHVLDYSTTWERVGNRWVEKAPF